MGRQVGQVHVWIKQGGGLQFMCLSVRETENPRCFQIDFPKELTFRDGDSMSISKYTFNAVQGE